MTVFVIFLVAKSGGFVVGCVFMRASASAVVQYKCGSMGMYHVCAHLS
jgi:hypothetical protein